MPSNPIVDIENVREPFCGSYRRNMIALLVGEPEISDEWYYAKNAGWGPEDFSLGSTVRCWWRCPRCHGIYKMKINDRTSTHRCGCPYCSGKRVSKANSLKKRFPDIATEWHPTKNKLKASEVTCGTKKRIWWHCKQCSHEWTATIADRTISKTGCPACYQAKRQYAREHPKPKIKTRVILGTKVKVSRQWHELRTKRDRKSLIETHPKLANQWHPTKNAPWTAFGFTSGSGTIVWWKCKKGPDHEWQASICERTRTKHPRCPFCTNRRVSITNSLQVRDAKVAKEWHPKSNGKLKPDQVTYASSRSVWWRCKRDATHEWEAKIYCRTQMGHGCPYCAGVRITEAESLLVQFPYIAAQLHPIKNGKLDPRKIACSSHKKLWWQCKKNPKHNWQAPVANRVYSGSNCPMCWGRRSGKTNSLAEKLPDVAKDWDKKKNGKLGPSEVTSYAKRIVWWHCPEGHSWRQMIASRVKSPVSCWVCKIGKPHGNQLKTAQSAQKPSKSKVRASKSRTSAWQ
jgi:hypothetical protein